MVPGTVSNGIASGVLPAAVPPAVTVEGLAASVVASPGAAEDSLVAHDAPFSSTAVSLK